MLTSLKRKASIGIAAGFLAVAPSAFLVTSPTASAATPRTYVVQSNFKSKSTCMTYWKIWSSRDNNWAKWTNPVCRKNGPGHNEGRWTLTVTAHSAIGGGGGGGWLMPR